MSPISRLARAAAATSAVALLFAVSACGSDDGGGSSATTPTKTVETGDIARVISVSIHQTGGLKPTDETRVFSEDGKPPAGFTRHDVETALDAAALLAASDVTTPRLSQGMCADCYQYAITLTFADGSATRYTVTGGVQQPQLLSDLLAATS
jgi:hypothetical protein